MKTLHNSLLVITLLLTTLYSISTARDTITPTRPLRDTETLVSSGGQFALGFFTPDNSTNRYVGLWYNKIAVRTILWVANRANPVVGPVGLLSITARGELTITDVANSTTIVWYVNATGARDGPVAQLLDTGNFVVRSEGGGYSWQGFDYPTDTLIPGMKIGIDRTTGRNRSLTAWRSTNDPSPGGFYGFMDVRGDPELYLSSSSGKIWRTGPWDGVRFSGIPDTVTYQGFSFSFVDDKEETTYSYNIGDKSVVSRLVVNESGQFQRSVWLWESSEWNFFWYAPKDPCDVYRQCGPYGACNPNESPMCECLLQQQRAFAPRSPGNWALRDGSEGCVRSTALDCADGTDGFVLVSNVKLPETRKSAVDRSLGLDQCRDVCLRNCSCTAYASANASGGGSGCVIWVDELFDIRVFVGAGQEIYVRVAVADIGAYMQFYIEF